jgi:hypothetical protein
LNEGKRSTRSFNQNQEEIEIEDLHSKVSGQTYKKSRQIGSQAPSQTSAAQSEEHNSLKHQDQENFNDTMNSRELFSKLGGGPAALPPSGAKDKDSRRTSGQRHNQQSASGGQGLSRQGEGCFPTTEGKLSKDLARESGMVERIKIDSTDEKETVRGVSGVKKELSREYSIIGTSFGHHPLHNYQEVVAAEEDRAGETNEDEDAEEYDEDIKNAFKQIGKKGSLHKLVETVKCSPVSLRQAIPEVQSQYQTAQSASVKTGQAHANSSRHLKSAKGSGCYQAEEDENDEGEEEEEIKEHGEEEQEFEHLVAVEDEDNQSKLRERRRLPKDSSDKKSRKDKQIIQLTKCLPGSSRRPTEEHNTPSQTSTHRENMGKLDSNQKAQDRQESYHSQSHKDELGNVQNNVGKSRANQQSLSKDEQKRRNQGIDSVRDVHGHAEESLPEDYDNRQQPLSGASQRTGNNINNRISIDANAAEVDYRSPYATSVEAYQSKNKKTGSIKGASSKNSNAASLQESRSMASTYNSKNSKISEAQSSRGMQTMDHQMKGSMQSYSSAQNKANVSSNVEKSAEMKQVQSINIEKINSASKNPKQHSNVHNHESSEEKKNGRLKEYQKELIKIMRPENTDLKNSSQSPHLPLNLVKSTEGFSKPSESHTRRNQNPLDDDSYNLLPPISATKAKIEEMAQVQTSPKLQPELRTQALHENSGRKNQADQDDQIYEQELHQGYAKYSTGKYSAAGKEEKRAGAGKLARGCAGTKRLGTEERRVERGVEQRDQEEGLGEREGEEDENDDGDFSRGGEEDDDDDNSEEPEEVEEQGQMEVEGDGEYGSEDGLEEEDLGEEEQLEDRQEDNQEGVAPYENPYVEVYDNHESDFSNTINTYDDTNNYGNAERLLEEVQEVDEEHDHTDTPQNPRSTFGKTISRNTKNSKEQQVSDRGSGEIHRSVGLDKNKVILLTKEKMQQDLISDTPSDALPNASEVNRHEIVPSALTTIAASLVQQNFQKTFPAVHKSELPPNIIHKLVESKLSLTSQADVEEDRNEERSKSSVKRTRKGSNSQRQVEKSVPSAKAKGDTSAKNSKKGSKKNITGTKKLKESTERLKSSKSKTKAKKDTDVKESGNKENSHPLADKQKSSAKLPSSKKSSQDRKVKKVVPAFDLPKLPKQSSKKLKRQSSTSSAHNNSTSNLSRTSLKELNLNVDKKLGPSTRGPSAKRLKPTSSSRLSRESSSINLM